MQSPTANHPAIGFDISEPLPLAKSESLCIDLSDLLGLKALKTSHSMSTNDSVSAKADEDTTKSVTSGEIEFSPVVSVPEQPERRITIKDIISKRAYTRRSNDNKNVSNDSQITSNNKKRLADLDGNTEEIIIKKEKLDEKKEFQGITASQANKSLLPELVFKDGKVQIAAPSSFEGGEIVKQELEVVHVGKKKVTMSTSFKQVTHTEKWTEKETQKFYRALELFGTDFSMIAKVFKTRNRNQIKNKFLREEKIAAEKVDTTLKRLKPNNFQVLFRKFEKLKKVQKAAEKTPLAENNIKINLLFPTQKTINPQDTKQDGIEIQIRARNERSGSFHSTTSVDSMDRAIIEDLADILMPKNNLLGM